MPSEEELYQEHILDHYEDPFHRGHLTSATHAHEDKNPLCGDVVRIELELNDEGKIKNVYFDGQGCVISQASASMLIEELYGKTVDDVKAFTAENMLELYGPRLTPPRWWSIRPARGTVSRAASWVTSRRRTPSAPTRAA